MVIEHETVRVQHVKNTENNNIILHHEKRYAEANGESVTTHCANEL